MRQSAVEIAKAKKERKKYLSKDFVEYRLDGKLYRQRLCDAMDFRPILSSDEVKEEKTMAEREPLMGLQTYASDGGLDSFYWGTQTKEYIERQRRLGKSDFTIRLELENKFSALLDRVFSTHERNADAE